MRSESAQKLIDAIDIVSEARGAKNVRLVHSVLVETCRYFEEKLGGNLYQRVIALQELPKIGDDVVGIVRDLYYLFGHNIIRVIDPPDAPLDMQQEIPYMIAGRLKRNGLSEEDICRIFCLGIDGVDKNKLPEIYSDNVYIKRDAHLI